MTMLTNNFSLHEMIKSETASRRDMDNYPHSDEIIANLTVLCEQVLQPLRDAYGVGIKVNSGYRSPDVNAAGLR
jgi:zinc D-Ala-D-Ala carboxypeptidase